MAELLGDRGPLDTCLQFAFDMGQAACGDSAGSRDLSASFVVDERRAEWYLPTLLHHFAGAEDDDMVELLFRKQHGAMYALTDLRLAAWLRSPTNLLLSVALRVVPDTTGQDLDWTASHSAKEGIQKFYDSPGCCVEEFFGEPWRAAVATPEDCTGPECILFLREKARLQNTNMEIESLLKDFETAASPKFRKPQVERFAYSGIV